MYRTLLALAIAGAALSMFFTYQMLNAVMPSHTLIAVVTLALLFQSSQYVYTFLLPRLKLIKAVPTVTAITLTVSCLYIMSIAASYIYMESVAVDEIKNAQAKLYQQQQTAAQLTKTLLEAEARESQAYVLAKQGYEDARQGVKNLDTTLEALHVGAALDTTSNYRGRAINSLERATELQAERVRALARLDERAKEVTLAFTLAAPPQQLTYKPSISPLFKQVSDKSRQALLLMIAGLLELCTVLAIVVYTAKPTETVKKAPETETTIRSPRLYDRISKGDYGDKPSQRQIKKNTLYPESYIRDVFKRLHRDNIIKKEKGRWVLVR